MPRKKNRLISIPRPKVDPARVAKQSQWRSDLAPLSREELVELAVSAASWVEILWKCTQDLELENIRMKNARSASGRARHAATTKIKEAMKKVWESDEWVLRRKTPGAITAFADFVVDQYPDAEPDAGTVKDWTREWKKPAFQATPIDTPPASDIFRLLMHSRKQE